MDYDLLEEALVTRNSMNYSVASCYVSIGCSMTYGINNGE